MTVDYDLKKPEDIKPGDIIFHEQEILEIVKVTMDLPNPDWICLFHVKVVTPGKKEHDIRLKLTAGMNHTYKVKKREKKKVNKTTRKLAKHVNPGARL